MKTVAASRTLHVIGCALTLLVLVAAPGAAQQSLEVPANQVSPPAYHRLRMTPLPTPYSPDVETLPQVAQSPLPPPPPPPPPPPAPPPPQVLQPAPAPTPQLPVLPAIFRGCWVGRVDFLDTITRLPGGPPLGSWTPKTYRLCYRRSGNGPFTLTFTEAGIAHNRRITNATGRMDLRSTDGHTYAAMRALLHFDEVRTHGSYFAGSTFPVDELTQLQCNIGPNGMAVTGQVFGEHGGTPWFKAAWHALFVHTPDEPRITE